MAPRRSTAWGAPTLEAALGGREARGVRKRWHVAAFFDGPLEYGIVPERLWQRPNTLDMVGTTNRFEALNESNGNNGSSCESLDSEVLRT